MLVLAVDVSHSPARAIMSRPVDSWLKNLGCPEIVLSINFKHNNKHLVLHCLFLKWLYVRTGSLWEYPTILNGFMDR